MNQNLLFIGGREMTKRGTGAIFCLISAILFSVRYIAAAIFLSGSTSWSAELFSSGLEYIGTPLLWGSIISLVIGIAYLLWAELSKSKNE